MQYPVKFFTVEEYIELEKSSQIRHEYLRGQIFALSEDSKEHNIIADNIYSRLRSHLRGSSCNTFMSEMKVKIKSAIENKPTFYYPDVIVSCDPQDQDRYFLNYPCLIIEVLSPNTEITKRREKLVNYLTLEKLREYVLICPDEIKIEIYRQDAQGNWTIQILGKDAQLNLYSVGLTLKMADIYEDVLIVD
ncbi:Uma2 family endonuclease [Cylindrospermum sp. FACHB-282]|uniref:Uma2 family endonuclease n=1 Tax=Cylindrospermum sp. FACHB-282 TaxID=2692794 RepID=UPI001683B6B5|nr:Uma2 family endonuclease [Cylindrospermum sp. FACHB-282]MBD2387521.1 Uma2 family endonuclease [Cylindrospermum sp. FACHB-282]